jgi:Lrp/AsnC family transcriptional regulator for asnA, asnC and gidA
MYKIDNIDLEIVNMLMEDGRMHAAEIARRIGNISERAVRYRIDRMVENEVIRLSAIVNPKGLGMSVVADVWLEVESGLILDVAKKMTEFENVSYVACSIGETDVSVQIQAHDTEEVYRFVMEVIGKVPGVRKTTTSIVPLVLKDVYQWRIPSGMVDRAFDQSLIQKNQEHAHEEF